MRQLLLVLLGRTRWGGLPWLGSGPPLLALAMMVVGCASSSPPSLTPNAQAVAIKERERALASHAVAIHETIRQSGKMGGLAFLDAKDGRLIVWPGDSPGDAWARHITSSESATSPVT
ncbi:MAG: hypothetical protein C5B48_00925, partial [Candidatus Rokuibacteriota bacterium]